MNALILACVQLPLRQKPHTKGLVQRAESAHRFWLLKFSLIYILGYFYCCLITSSLNLEICFKSLFKDFKFRSTGRFHSGCYRYHQQWFYTARVVRVQRKKPDSPGSQQVSQLWFPTSSLGLSSLEFEYWKFEDNMMVWKQRESLKEAW